MWDDYVWVVVVGSFLAFFTAFGIGANDVANAFATSVGAKAITLEQAVVLAAFCEFGGAVLIGAKVTDTVRKKIADLDAFEEDPEVLMYGMLCVLASTGLWLTLASYLELPVSTTHSVIGGIIGMALVFKGADAVEWYEFDDSKSDLDKFKGVVPVIASWFISPFLSAGFAVVLFFGVRLLILRREDSDRRAFWFFPLLVGLTVTINVYFIVFKGFSRKIKHNGEKKELEDILGDWSHLLAWGSGALSAVIVLYVVLPILKQSIENLRQRQSTALVQDTETEPRTAPEVGEEDRADGVGGLKGLRDAVFGRDIHAVVDNDAQVSRIHDQSERFDPYTEEIFKYLQVFTAMCDSFAHGANDVANSIGPFASIYMIYRKESANSTASVPEWILVLGGVGIVLGLGTYGYNIIRAIGVKLIRVTASRGFSIELGAAIVVILGSQYGIPLSTTHCQVGATVGVGLLEGTSGVNFALLLKVIGGWLVTLLVVGCTTAALFAQGAYAPSIVNLRTCNRYEKGLAEISEMLGDQLGIEQAVDQFNAEIYDDKNDDSSRQIAQVKEWLTEQFDTCVATP